MKQQSQKRIVITGGTRGIGLALAQDFLDRGWMVCICGTSKESVSSTLSQFDQTKAQIFGLPCNVENEQEVQALWDFAVKSMGSVDVWINNAGVGQKSVSVTELPPEVIHRIVSVNIAGTIFGTVCALKGMAAQGSGSIYNMEGFGSNGMMGNGLSVYGASKRALRYFTHAIARENREKPISIGTLSPGMVMTDFLLEPLAAMEESRASQARKVFSILADEASTVANYLGKKIAHNARKNPHFDWLPMGKVAYRFLTASFRKNRFPQKS